MLLTNWTNLNMITNIFNVFTLLHTFSNQNMNWAGSILIFFIWFPPYWIFPSSPWLQITKIKTLLTKELANLLLPSNFNGSTLIIIALFTYILYNNTIGLFPYTLTATRLLVITITSALPFWTRAILYRWFNNTSHISTSSHSKNPLSTYVFCSMHWNYYKYNLSYYSISLTHS